MALSKIEKKWALEAQALLQKISTPWGIRAAHVDLTNYDAVFSRDAAMSGIAGILLKDKKIIKSFVQSTAHFKKLQGAQGQIASNYTVQNGTVKKVSYGTLSPKIDACTWYLISVAVLLKTEHIAAADYEASIQKTIALLDAWEYNDKHLIYIPKGGNWADEYVYDGYVLYDQILRAWALALLGKVLQRTEWTTKANAIQGRIIEQYPQKEGSHFNSSFYPGGVFERFDLAAHALGIFIFEKENTAYAQALDWIADTFIEEGKMPPAFHPVIKEGDSDWAILRKYHLFDFKNKPHHYHNGGIWWIWLGWLAVAFSLAEKKEALEKLSAIAFEFLEQHPDFEFDEYLASDTLQPHGTKQLGYTATGIIFMALAKEGFDFSVLQSK